jgi:hypothetical protein
MARRPKRGRPPRHKGEVLRKNRTFRIRARLDQLLEEAAAKAGRSTSEEIEHRLEVSFLDERRNADMLGSDVGAEILRAARALMVFEAVGRDWDGNPAKAENLRTALNAVIAVLTGLPLELPPSEKRVEGLQAAKALLLRSSKKGDLPKEIMFSDLERPEFGETE